MKKGMKLLLSICLISMLMVVPGYAKVISQGIYLGDTAWMFGTQPKALPTAIPDGHWAWVDLDGDGVAQSYYFLANGTFLKNAYTPDGYYVDSEGRWVQNGKVQDFSFASMLNGSSDVTIRTLQFNKDGFQYSGSVSYAGHPFTYDAKFTYLTPYMSAASVEAILVDEFGQRHYTTYTINENTTSFTPYFNFIYG